MWPNPQFPADLVTFTVEILNWNLHFLYSESCRLSRFSVPKCIMRKGDQTEIFTADLVTFTWEILERTLLFLYSGLTHFSPMFPFYIPLKTPENLWFSSVFRGYKMETLTR